MCEASLDRGFNAGILSGIDDMGNSRKIISATWIDIVNGCAM